MTAGFQRDQAYAGDNPESYSRRPMSQAGQKAVNHPHDKLHLQKYARKSIGAHARIIPAASTGENRSMTCVGCLGRVNLVPMCVVVSMGSRLWPTSLHPKFCRALEATIGAGRYHFRVFGWGPS